MNKIFLFFLCLGFVPFTYAQTIIEMEQDGGVYKIPCVVNGLKLKFIFDTGASRVCISQSIATMMLENDYLSIEDIKGSSQSQVADGRIVDNTRINLKKIQIGDKVLTNIEAVVIHQQDAPLLLGQSAIQKLGKYSISDGQLIFGATTLNNNKKENIIITDEEKDRLLSEAINAYNEGAYLYAIEKYELLYNTNKLSSYGIMRYADCLYYVKETEKALSLYREIETDLVSEFPDKEVDLYFQIGRSLGRLKDYQSAIRYLEKAKYLSGEWTNTQSSSVQLISKYYYAQEKYYQACKNLETYINQYLEFMDIKATDCWEKCYTDDFLADLYYARSLYGEISDYDDYYKYIIISAAWGSSEAQEDCKKYNLSYTSKPYKYEY